MTLEWGPDILGEGFEAATLTLPDDEEGSVTATLVRATAPPAQLALPAQLAPPAPRGSVLYLHGYSDYFFQADLARFVSAAGWAFYALDLRKYGRSLLPHQTPNFCASLETYDPELDAAAAEIAREGPGPLLLVAHSTGGLIGPLWAARRPGRVAGMVLNSAFLDFKQPPALSAALRPLIRAVAARRPKAVFPSGVSDRYTETLHASRSGEWDYNPAWKPFHSFPVRFGWLAAVAAGHARVRAGLGLDIPVLAMSSDGTATNRAPLEERRHADVVLDATRIAAAATGISSQVTVVRIAGGMHDLFLSTAAARASAYAELGRWLEQDWQPPGDFPT